MCNLSAQIICDVILRKSDILNSTGSVDIPYQKDELQGRLFPIASEIIS